MITDSIDNLKRYAVPKTDAILKFITDHNCANLPDGEIEIEGRQLFVRIMSYTSKPAQENRFETHVLHADLQYLVNGSELMQTARMKDLTPLGDRDTQGDYQFFNVSGATSDFIVQAGEFVVFYPNQPHRPSCAYEDYKGLVKKLVFKIRVN